MAEPVLYVRGFPSSSWTEHIASNPEALQDILTVVGLSQDKITAIQRRLSDAKGFLSPKGLLALLREELQDESLMRCVRRTILNLGPDDVEPLLEALSARHGQEPSLDDKQLDGLRRVLPQLVKPYPALAAFKKADRLSTQTGQRLESIDLICDLRPIFDESRTHLEGMMPYTRLLVVAIGADGLPKAFESELTRQQVHDLAQKASKATQKLGVLLNAIETDWLPGGLPDLPLTREPRKEPSDA